jgi:ParB family chromosome partitioning protein
MKTKRNALGRGLSAILESPATDITSRDISGDYVAGAIASISIDKIEANPFQPRNRIEAETLVELSESIREQGVIQPLTVRKLGYDKYQLISGERRLRAAKMAGLTDIPCFIRVANDQQMLELALIENIHREDLNALDIAISFQRLVEECSLTQEKLSERVGKNRSTIANYIRLLKLPPDIQVALRDNIVSMGHARALINIEDPAIQLRLLKEIIKNSLSVRQVEQRVKKIGQAPLPARQATSSLLTEAHQAFLHRLNDRYGAKTQIVKSPRGGGKLIISFGSEDALTRFIESYGS